MRSNMKKVFSIFLLLSLVFTTAFVGCGKKTEAPKKKKAATKVEKKVTGPKDSKSILTGLDVTKEQMNTRPFAIMTENTKDAIPQYGLNSASIIFECPVEGGITRLMVMYENTEGLERIGNVRSCRPYYVYFAAEYGAIYTHFGQSEEGAEALSKKLTPEINGLSSVGGKVFYRSSDRKAPHNAYTSGNGLQAGVEKLGIDKTFDSAKFKHFNFGENKLEDGAPANKVSLYFFNNKPYFTYDASTGLYKRYQFGREHIDKNDGKIITVKNIILQNVSSQKFNANKGTLNLGVVGSGTGKYITNGKVVDITWKKESVSGVTHYYDKSGKELTLNPGKTWISVIENNYAERNTFE